MMLETLRSAVERRGGKRALLMLCATPVLIAARGPRALLRPETRAGGRLVFVCSGNICRSPFAAEYARALGLPSASFGLHADDGAAANPQALAAARRRGIHTVRCS